MLRWQSFDPVKIPNGWFKPTETPEDGQLVIAMYDDDDFEIGRYSSSEDMLTLQRGRFFVMLDGAIAWLPVDDGC